MGNIIPEQLRVNWRIGINTATSHMLTALTTQRKQNLFGYSLTRYYTSNLWSCNELYQKHKSPPY